MRDSHGTVAFSIATALTGGSKTTVTLAHKHGKPVLHLFRSGGPASPEMELVRFIRHNRIQVLNVAGSRASKEPEAVAFVRATLEALWAHAHDFGVESGLECW